MQNKSVQFNYLIPLRRLLIRAVLFGFPGAVSFAVSATTRSMLLGVLLAILSIAFAIPIPVFLTAFYRRRIATPRRLGRFAFCFVGAMYSPFLILGLLNGRFMRLTAISFFAFAITLFCIVLTWIILDRFASPIAYCDDERCHGCGYDIRGFEDGRCPECGGSIHESRIMAATEPSRE